jgi:hypothetical protein
LVVAAIAATGCHRIAHEDAQTNSSSAVPTVVPERAVAPEGLEIGERRPALPAPRGIPLDDAVEEDQADVAEVIARERNQVRRTLLREIRWIDRHLASLRNEASIARGALRSERLRDVDTARQWQTRLKQDLEAIDRVSDKVWPALKDHIDRRLEEEHPATVPRSYDEALEI